MIEYIHVLQIDEAKASVLWNLIEAGKATLKVTAKGQTDSRIAEVIDALLANGERLQATLKAEFPELVEWVIKEGMLQ